MSGMKKMMKKKRGEVADVGMVRERMRLFGRLLQAVWRGLAMRPPLHLTSSTVCAVLPGS